MARLRVEVVYARRENQQVVLVELEEGACALDAVRASGLGAQHPEINARDPVVGIFGRRVARETLLHDGDRLEIYRPLLIDPKAARMAKAKKRPKR